MMRAKKKKKKLIFNVKTLHSVHFCHQTIYNPISVSHGEGGMVVYNNFQNKPWPNVVSPRRSRSLHWSKLKVCIRMYDEVGILPPKHQSTLQSVYLRSGECRGESNNRSRLLRSLESICVYLRSREWRAMFRRNWRCCLAFPADLSEHRRQNEVRRSKCALQWHCRALPWSILRSKKFVFGVFTAYKQIFFLIGPLKPMRAE
jgi:hypothetical protein